MQGSEPVSCVAEPSFQDYPRRQPYTLVADIVYVNQFNIYSALDSCFKQVLLGCYDMAAVEAVVHSACCMVSFYQQHAGSTVTK